MNPGKRRWWNLTAFGLRKLAGIVVGLVVLATLVFVLLKLIPGDEARVVAGPTATPEQLEEIRERLGLNGSLLDQYLAYMSRLIAGDLGASNKTRAPVLGSILHVLPSTFELVVISTLMIVVFALPAAGMAAMGTRRTLETLRRLVIIVAAAIPAFWLGLVLQRWVASEWGLFPISDIYSFGMGAPVVTGGATMDAIIAGRPDMVLDSLWHLILPAFALALPYVGQLYRVTRSEILRAETQMHVVVARAVGVGRPRLVRRHIFPHAMTPAISMVGVEFGALFAGAIFVESIFARPGIGSFLSNAVQQKDTPSVLGGVLVIGVIVILANYIVDIIQILRDPRLRSVELGA